MLDDKLQQTLKWAVQGRTIKDMSVVLHISESQVNRRLRALYREFNVTENAYNRRARLTYLAQRDQMEQALNHWRWT